MQDAENPKPRGFELKIANNIKSNPVLNLGILMDLVGYRRSYRTFPASTIPS